MSAGLVTLNNIVGHFIPPTSVVLTPFLLPLLATIIFHKENEMGIIIKSLLLALLVILNDAGIKLYAGGAHDRQGLSFVNGAMLIGLVPAFGILTFSILRRKEQSVNRCIVAILVLPALISIYLIFFMSLGLGRRF